MKGSNTVKTGNFLNYYLTIKAFKTLLEHGKTDLIFTVTKNLVEIFQIITNIKQNLADRSRSYC